MAKNFKNIFFNESNNILLEDFNLTNEDAVILDLATNFENFLNDEKKIDMIKKIASQEKDTIHFFIIYEKFENDIKNIANYHKYNKELYKLFHKFSNVFIFVKNLDLSHLSIEEKNTLNISDSNFYEKFKKDYSHLVKSTFDMHNNKYVNEFDSSYNNLIDQNNEDQSHENNDENNDQQAEKSHDFVNVVFENQNENNDIPINLLNDFINENKLEYSDEFDSINLEPKLDRKEYILKSIFDYIWRMYILNSKNDAINDLLFSVVSSMPLFSIGQSDYLRELTSNALSLFDLILKIDSKLKFNNTLFYLFLANFFCAKSNKIILNKVFALQHPLFLKENEDEFTLRIEEYINNNKNHVSKIIYCHFVEYCYFVKSCIPRIMGSLRLKDVSQIIVKRNNFFRKRNIFSIIITNLINIARELNIDLLTVLNDKTEIYKLENETKIEIAEIYAIVLLEIKNFVLLQGSNEEAINKLYSELRNIDLTKIIDTNQPILEVGESFDDLVLKINDDGIVESPEFSDPLDIKYNEIEDLYNEDYKFELDEPTVLNLNNEKEMELKYGTPEQEEMIANDYNTDVTVEQQDFFSTPTVQTTDYSYEDDLKQELEASYQQEQAYSDFINEQQTSFDQEFDQDITYNSDHHSVIEEEQETELEKTINNITQVEDLDFDDLSFDNDQEINIDDLYKISMDDLSEYERIILKNLRKARLSREELEQNTKKIQEFNDRYSKTIDDK